MITADGRSQFTKRDLCLDNKAVRYAPKPAQAPAILTYIAVSCELHRYVPTYLPIVRGSEKVVKIQNVVNNIDNVVVLTSGWTNELMLDLEE